MFKINNNVIIENATIIANTSIEGTLRHYYRHHHHLYNPPSTAALHGSHHLPVSGIVTLAHTANFGVYACSLSVYNPRSLACS